MIRPYFSIVCVDIKEALSILLLLLYIIVDDDDAGGGEMKNLRNNRNHSKQDSHSVGYFFLFFTSFHL